MLGLTRYQLFLSLCFSILLMFEIAKKSTIFLVSLRSLLCGKKEPRRRKERKVLVDVVACGCAALGSLW